MFVQNCRVLELISTCPHLARRICRRRAKKASMFCANDGEDEKKVECEEGGKHTYGDGRGSLFR